MLQPCLETGVPVARQKKILEAINADPLGSYVFSGPPGAGKTTVLREIQRLARIARPVNFAVYANSMMRYQNDSTAVARGESISGPFVKPSTIYANAQSKIRWGIFIDDFDKCSGSEFLRLQLFDLVNTIYETGSQFVVTTNSPLAT